MLMSQLLMLNAKSVENYFDVSHEFSSICSYFTQFKGKEKLMTGTSSRKDNFSLIVKGLPLRVLPATPYSVDEWNFASSTKNTEK